MYTYKNYTCRLQVANNVSLVNFRSWYVVIRFREESISQQSTCSCKLMIINLNTNAYEFFNFSIRESMHTYRIFEYKFKQDPHLGLIDTLSRLAQFSNESG